MNQQKMLEWIGTHQIGRASRTMWTGLMGFTPVPKTVHKLFGVPTDCAAFAGCYDLVSFAEVTPAELQRICAIFPWYKPIIDNWDDLVTVYLEGNSIGLYTYLQHLKNMSDYMRGH